MSGKNLGPAPPEEPGLPEIPVVESSSPPFKRRRIVARDESSDTGPIQGSVHHSDALPSEPSLISEDVGPGERGPSIERFRETPQSLQASDQSDREQVLRQWEASLQTRSNELDEREKVLKRWEQRLKDEQEKWKAARLKDELYSLEVATSQLAPNLEDPEEEDPAPSVESDGEPEEDPPSQITVSGDLEIPEPTPDVNGLVNTYDFVTWSVKGALCKLYRKQRNHPMFGDQEEGKIRLPLTLPPAPNAVSWEKKAEALARGIAKVMGGKINPRGCWMLGDRYGSVQRKGATTIFRFNYYRWLYFLSDPSQANWEIFTSATSNEVAKEVFLRLHPFVHVCNNGHSSKKARLAEADLLKAAGVADLSDKLEEIGCVNGLEHGFFSTPVINNQMKPCMKPGMSRPQCPTHGEGDEKYSCFWVFLATGAPRPCRNMEKTPKDCVHTPSCFL